MAKILDQVKRNWIQKGFNGLLFLPINTDLVFLKGERHIINHRSIHYVWVNGNEKCFPLVFIPIKNYALHSDFLEFDYGAYDNFLEYLSLLSLYNKNTRIDLLHRSFKNYFTHCFDQAEILKPFYKRNLIFNSEKVEFKMNSDLSKGENLILSIFRDANSSENVFYSFLSFFRILELSFLDESLGKDKKWIPLCDWIDNNFLLIKEDSQKLYPGLGDFNYFLKFFNKSNLDRIGKYLVQCCRNALAHSKNLKKGIKTPSSFIEYLEISYASNYVKAASLLVIKNELKKEILVK